MGFVYLLCDGEKFKIGMTRAISKIQLRTDMILENIDFGLSAQADTNKPKAANIQTIFINHTNPLVMLYI